MNTDSEAAVDAYINGIILLSKNISDHDYSTLDSDFLFKGDYKCLKKAVAYARETVDKVMKKQPLPINPLIFVGEVNSCKNRLLFAMWNSLLKQKVNKGEGEPVCFYLQIASDHDPMSDLYDSFSDMEKKAVYRKMTEIIKGTDMIFIDEIQYLEGKHKTLNLMLEATKFMESINKPIVMTSQKMDIDKTKLVPELAERLENFEYIKIPLPDVEDRIKMLEDFLKKENLSLENPSLRDRWAKNTEKYPLKCLLNKLNRLACEAEGKVVTAKTIEQVFETKDFAEKILYIVSEYFQIDIKTLVKEERKFAYERSVAMYFIKSENRGMNFCEVGKKLDRGEDTARIACDGIERALNGGKDFFNKRKPVQIIADVEEIRGLLQPS